MLRRPRRPLTLGLGLALILGWQSTLILARDRLDRSFQLTASKGLNEEYRFAYFLYYLGLYPVTSDEGHTAFLGEPGYRRFSREAALRIVRERGETLLMEWKHTIRVGERGKVFLYLPDALWKGAPRPPLSVLPLHGALFLIALCALWASFWWARLPLLGALLTLLLGSNPFQLFEVYGHDNVFGWPITTGVLVLALNLPLLRARGVAAGWAASIAVATGALLATIAQVRSEPATILAASALACLFLARAGWGRRLLLVALLVGAFAGVSALWGRWFDAKFEDARRVVAAAGGHPYDGPRDAAHSFWHPLWCGLGDFDRTHGYVWNDNAAARYAHPILAAKYHVDLPEWDPDHWAYYGAYWDAGRRYYKMPYEMPHYSEVVRDKVVGDVAADPAWYAGILVQRAWRLLSETTPARLAVGGGSLALPVSGLLLLPLLGFLAATRNAVLLKLALFPLATSLPALLVYSGDGMSFYSWYHLVAAAIVGSVALAAGLAWTRRLRRS